MPEYKEEVMKALDTHYCNLVYDMDQFYSLFSTYSDRLKIVREEKKSGEFSILFNFTLFSCDVFKLFLSKLKKHLKAFHF